MNVGVVIPVRDGARYLAEALDSVLAQTHPAADIVVVDDGSRDRTARVAAAYAPRVRCLSVPGRGIGAARNRGVAEVGGELIAFLDGDDSWPPDRLERQLSAFADDASAPDVVFGHIEQFLSPDLDAAARAGLTCPKTPQPAQLANTMLVPRTVWERVGPFSTTAVRSEFLDWLLRARELDLREVMIEDVVLRRRLHATNHGRVLHDSAGEYAVTLKRALDRRRRAVTPSRSPVVVLGGGPAGLTAGYLLARRGEPVIVLEAGRQVGGLARTEVRDGYRFDLGGHRFYTKHAEVDALWREIMGDELLTRPRQSRIYWRGRFLDYPLHGADVVRKLGAVELMLCGASYLMAATRPRGGEQNLEEWVSNRFGRRLYQHFFEAYTQKVWGVPAREIRAEWAAQRIRGLSFASAARAALTGGGRDIVSLVGEFRYPRLGPGQMWERMQDEIRAHGGEVRLNAAVTALSIAEGRVVELVAGGETIRPSHVISSLPLRTTVGIADPEAPADVREAARGLRYRDFLTVLLVLSERNIFPDNWIYVHDPGVRVGRIQNFRAWSPGMVPNDEDGSVGLEYFCFAGDELWRMDDEALVALATRELSEIGLADPGMVKRGYAVRVEKAYPMYDAAYPERVATIRAWLTGIANLQQIGRNGLHRYNSSDHSMLTAMRAVDNLAHGARHDIWTLDTDSVYQEEYAEAEQPYREAPETEAMARPLADVR